jgi:polyisoprenoid-binding protein YceI
MKTMFTSLALSLSLAVSSASFSAPSKIVPGNYTVDPAHTRVEFVIPHLVISKVEGRFNDVSGTIVLAEPFTNSKFDAVVQTKSVDTAVAKRDEHLRTADFFDATKYPTLTLKTKSISGTAESFKLVASLTIKDVTKDVTFDGKYLGTVKDPWGNTRAAFEAKAKINRKEFNIKYDEKFDGGASVGDEVEISLISEATKAK